MSFPYLDVVGLKLRATLITPEDIDLVDSRYPGFFVQAIASRTSYINSRLRKRYGASNNGNALPLGQQPPVLVASGTLPPPVILVGVPTLGSLRMLLQITSGGAFGAALFQWSLNGGTTFAATGVVTGAPVVLGATGLSANFSSTAGNYGIDNLYAAATPVPEAVLRWLTIMVTADAWDRRGRNPQDPTMATLEARLTTAEAELKEASDSKDGLFDLPISEDLDSAVTTGGPMSYSETSPYVWTDLQQQTATGEDCNQSGTGQG